MLGLPDAISAYPFDLGGVLTQTAKVHADLRRVVVSSSTTLDRP
jgi:hypothetical protein